MSTKAHEYERLATNILYRLQVCLPEYSLEVELHEEGYGMFATFHLTKDGADKWTEDFADWDGTSYEVKVNSLHLRLPMPALDTVSAGYVQGFRRATVKSFLQLWFEQRMKLARLEL